MFCEACGTQLQPAQHFCSNCGKPVSPNPFAATRATGGGRVARHIHVVSIFWLIFAGLHVLAGLIILAAGNLLFQALEHGSYADPLFVRPIVNVIALLIAGKGLLAAAAGIGLLKRAAWARGLTLFLAFVSLFELPFGTALGIYTFWVLRSSNSEHEYRALVAGG
jgi:hypothetical protein